MKFDRTDMTEENAAVIAAIIREDAKINGVTLDDDFDDDDSAAWKTVSYPRRQKKQGKPPANPPPEDSAAGEAFRQIDEISEARRRRLVESQRAPLEAAGGGSRDAAVSGDDSGEDDASLAGDAAAGKKPRAKKAKKPRVSLAEAAAKIDADDLAAFLIDVSGSYESQNDVQLMRFADYFGRALASVGSAQFPWMKLLKESTVAKMVDIPLSQVPEPVYKTSMDWLNRQPLEPLGSFVLWLWDGILADLASHQAPIKGSKKVAQQPTPKSQVALFVVLGMTLRRKPDALISLLPLLQESQKYLGHDKLPVTVWVITQASQGDLAVGLYLWVQVLLPMLNKKSVNPQSRDLILQLVERILSTPKSRQILVNGAVRKGERLVPPASLDTLMRLTFPSASTRVKATERFEAIYPTLKEVALAGASGSKAMKQVAQQILSVAFKTVAEGAPELSKEASNVFIWCLTENPECFKQWDKLYLDNIEASATVLKGLVEEKKLHSAPPTVAQMAKAALKSFKQKNEKAMASKEYSDRMSSLKDADKSCRSLLSQVSRGSGCVKVVAVSAVAALGLAAMYMVPSEETKQLIANFKLDDISQLLAKLNIQV